ncbi:MFS transporter [Umezawaea beigongshangensis]|uniref:MFS transporter n=1 Tax=Umezawaea beigongshangensis TaxID=2780383 RepID=UPI0018F206CF|nr:MFS transporter [Umezawaea beigongshangensis]
MPDTTTDEVRRPALVRAFAASLSGTALEWYDFAIYNVAAAVVLGPLFFPSADPLTGTLSAFSTYAVGYLSRPLGGFFFGRLGDVLGRKKILVITLLITGIATLLIGLLPTNAAIGGTAGVLLVVLRFAQGVGLGGEWGGAVLLSSEYGDPRKRGFWASAAQIGPPAGNLMANGVLALLGVALTEEQFFSWGWRVAFLLSAVLVAFGLWIRVKLEETPVFTAIRERGERPSAPIREVVRTETRPLIAAILCRVGPDVLYALFTVFVLTYITTQLGLPRNAGLTAVLVASACQLVLMPLAGALSDRFNRRRLYAVAAVGGAVWPFLFFPLIGSGSRVLLVLGVVVGLAFHAFMYGPQAAFISEQFSPRLRYTGSSLAYTLAGIVGGAVAPLMFTVLLAGFGTWLVIAAYVAVACAVTLAGLYLGRDPRPEDDEELAALAGA